jgi:hypothetical protein
MLHSLNSEKYLITYNQFIIHGSKALIMTYTIEYTRDMTVPLGTWSGFGKSRLSTVSFPEESVVSNGNNEVSGARPKPKLKNANAINPEFMKNIDITISTRTSNIS